MSKKVNNIEFKGKKAFVKQPKRKAAQGRKHFQTVFDQEKVPPFGQLGSPFLTPPSRRNQWGLAQQKPWKPIEKFDSTGHLSEEEKMKRLSAQVADTVQQQLDEALKNKKTETANTSAVSQEKEQASTKAPIGVKLLYLGAGLLLAGMVYAVYTQIDKAKPKTA